MFKILRSINWNGNTEVKVHKQSYFETTKLGN